MKALRPQQNISLFGEYVEMYSLYYAPQFLKKYWRTRQLRRLVSHAAHNITLYRDLLAKAGVQPSQIRRAADMKLLPVISRENFKGFAVHYFTDTRRAVSQFWYKRRDTSGGSFSFVGGLSSNFNYNDFVSFHFLLSHGRTPWELLDVKIARIPYLEGYQDIRKNRLSIFATDFFSNTDTAIARIAAFAPLVLEASPSILLEIAKKMTAGSVLKITPRFVVTKGELLTSEVRSHLSKTFEAKLYDTYSTAEAGTIGLECSQHDGFHLVNDVLIVEVVDEHGQNVSAGKAGRIIVTDLSNLEMPFIRYETGDEGFFMESPCPCGDVSPRIKMIGRRSL